jgi:hypothetical protein
MVAEVRTDDFTDILYKYTDAHGADQILANRTLRFTRPSEMNDPFDVRIDEWIGTDLKEFYESAAPLIAQKLLSDPNVLARRMGAKPAKAVVDDFQNRPEKERAAFLDELARWTIADFDQYAANLERSTTETRTQFARAFGSYGIFCATRTFTNLLMWAHYADKHRGAVLGFRPDLQNDSMLRLMKPVRYSEQRAHGIDTVEEYAASLGVPSIQTVRKIVDKLLHTKSKEWAYEQELRLSVADAVTDGQSAKHFLFLPNEIEEVYLGYRMSQEKKAEISQLSKALNPNVRIFAARLAKRTYALEFESVV